MSEPTLTEVSITQSMGGKIQIRKYVQDASYFVSESRKYSVPEDWTEEQVLAFQQDKSAEMRERVDAAATAEYEELADQSESFE